MKTNKQKFNYKYDSKKEILYGGNISKFASSKSNLFYGTSDYYNFSKGLFINSLLMVNVIRPQFCDEINSENVVCFLNEVADRTFNIIVRTINEAVPIPDKLKKQHNNLTWALFILQLKKVGFYLFEDYLYFGYPDENGTYKYDIVWSNNFYKWHSIVSTNIERFYYDFENFELCFKFLNSPKYYIYYGVSPYDYISFITSDDLGKYFAREIKNKYDYKVVSQQPH